MNNSIIQNWENTSSASPIFIIGCQRSGTTLLRTILHSHPDISIGYECAFYKLLAQKYDCSIPINERLEEFIEDLYRVRRFDLWNLEKRYLRQEFLKIDREVSFSQAVLLIAELYRRENKPKASFVGFKNPNGIFHLPYIFDLFPNAKVIHIMRDVRGLLASEKKKRKRMSIDTYDAASCLWDVSQRYKRAVNTYVDYKNDDRVHTLFFHDLIQNIDETTARLSDWLNIDHHDLMLSYFKLNNEKKLTPDSELWQHKKTMEAPDRKRIDAFKNELDSSELRAVELLFKNEINRFSGVIEIQSISLKGVPLILKSFGTRAIKKFLINSD
ncbi:MAG: sulfotransferase family protein [Arenicellales bacterium]